MFCGLWNSTQLSTGLWMRRKRPNFPLRATRHICGLKSMSPRWFWLLPAACRIPHKAAPTVWATTADLKSHMIACLALWKNSQFPFPVHGLCLSIHANISRSTLSRWFGGSVCWASQSLRYLALFWEDNLLQSVQTLSLTAHAILNLCHYYMWFHRLQYPLQLLFAPHSAASQEQYEATACIQYTHPCSDEQTSADETKTTKVHYNSFLQNDKINTGTIKSKSSRKRNEADLSEPCRTCKLNYSTVT